MGRFIEGCDRRQQLFLPDCVDDYVAEDSPVRIVDVFVDELDLAALGFADAAATGRPGGLSGLTGAASHTLVGTSLGGRRTPWGALDPFKARERRRAGDNSPAPPARSRW